MNRRDDVSYGTYLYAWPVTNLLLWYAPGLSLAALGVLTLAASLLLGLVSWRLVERPAQTILRRRAELVRRLERTPGLATA